jgi:hypothetical protein
LLRKSVTIPSRFISVEIAIRTDGECDAFVEWFRGQDNYVEKLACETHRWHVYFAPLPSGCADRTIRDICEGMSDWPEVVRRQWDEAALREFVVGYEVGTEAVVHLDRFDPSTLELVARVGAGIGIALYPAAMGGVDAETDDAEEVGKLLRPIEVGGIVRRAKGGV